MVEEQNGKESKPPTHGAISMQSSRDSKVPSSWTPEMVHPMGALVRLGVPTGASLRRLTAVAQSLKRLIWSPPLDACSCRPLSSFEDSANHRIAKRPSLAGHHEVQTNTHIPILAIALLSTLLASARGI